MRKKFFSYVTYQNQDGSKNEQKTSISNKLILVYTDKIIFYSSSESGSSSIENEKPMNKQQDEESIERIINFSDIILDCGFDHNKLCHAENYPQILNVPTFDIVKRAIPDHPGIKCLTLPFFENSYKKSHEKIAFICVRDSRLLKDLIEFKSSLSRAIESFQMRINSDRFNAFNGLLRKQIPIISFVDNKPVPSIARLYGKKIILVSNDKSSSFISEFSLYQLRNRRAYTAHEAVKLGILDQDWNGEFEASPTDDCCLVFPGGI
jgi:hypothetical protein